MAELTALDLHYVAKELGQFVGAKVEKIVQSDVNKRDVLMTLYLKDHPKLQLRFLLPGLVCLMEAKPESYPTVPPGFAMFLRKYLGGTRLTAVQQRGFDRIITLTFASKVEQYNLLVEFMQPGNMLLLSGDVIKNLLENQHYKDRNLRGGLEYVAPPAPFDLTQASAAEIADRVHSSTRDSVVTTLAIHLGLGGVYAEEACVRAGVEKSRSDLHQDEVHKVAQAVHSLLNQPIAVHKDENKSYPFALQSRTAEPVEGTFLHALGQGIDETPHAEKTQKQKAPKKNKLQTMIDAQRLQVDAMRELAQQEQHKGERIFEEYALVQEIIAKAKEAREKKQDVTAALAELKQVKQYDKATGEVVLEFE